MVHETRYAVTRDGVHIAYQIVGDGHVDLVLCVSGFGLGQVWQGRRSGAFLERLASFSRLIIFDFRGTGYSDHVVEPGQLLTIESRMEDVRAVMDAAGSERAVLLGVEPTGWAVALLFATTLPERTVGVALYASARANSGLPTTRSARTPPSSMPRSRTSSGDGARPSSHRSG